MKPTKPGTKTARVLDYLKTGHSLDIPKAIGMWGHIRLSDVIFRLRQKGHRITTELVKNGSVEYAIYRLPRAVTKDTKKGTKVRVRESATSTFLDSRYIGKVGFLRGHSREEGFECQAHIEGFTGTTHFNYAELEVV